MNVLITGGSGFIGSNLVEALLADERVQKVRVLDNLSTGFLRNLAEFLDRPDFEFLEGDIRDFDTCLEACKDIDLISHQAALGSVPRSITDPLTTNDVNVSGTLNIFYAAIQEHVKRVVFAASSSTYGDSKELPKIEEKIGKPLSPYAVTKLVNEQYADVFSKTYDFEFIGLRYFNIFGPKQDPNGAYAAVIPLFFKAAIDGSSPVINGDGSYSRDFTFVENAVQANILSLFVDAKKVQYKQQMTSPVNQVYNIACGEKVSLNELWSKIKQVTGSNVEAKYGPNRIGDVPHSLANIEKATHLIQYKGDIKLEDGLTKVRDWFKSKTSTNE